MNWDAISAISQLIGSLAVVLSVLYLAVQVHQSTRVAKVAMQDAAATALREVTKPLMENAELERIWRVGLEDISALSVEERARFFHAAYQFLKAFETIHFHHIYGMMDRDLWEGWHGLLRHYVVAPGMAHYWNLPLQSRREVAPSDLLARSRHGDYELAVLLGDEVFGAAGGAAAWVLFLNLDDELFRWFEIQANFAGWSVHRRCRFFNVLRRE